MGFAERRQIEVLSLRVTQLENRLESLARGLGVKPAEYENLPVRGTALSDAVLVHLRAGQKIAAIKQYRDETGADLRTAKNAVEQALR